MATALCDSRTRLTWPRTPLYTGPSVFDRTSTARQPPRRGRAELAASVVGGEVKYNGLQPSWNTKLERSGPADAVAPVRLPPGAWRLVPCANSAKRSLGAYGAAWLAPIAGGASSLGGLSESTGGGRVGLATYFRSGGRRAAGSRRRVVGEADLCSQRRRAAVDSAVIGAVELVVAAAGPSPSCSSCRP